MEFCHFFLFVTFVVLTVDQFVERGDGPFELIKHSKKIRQIWSKMQLCLCIDKKRMSPCIKPLTPEILLLTQLIAKRNSCRIIGIVI